MRSLNTAGERCREKQIPGLLAVFPIPEQFLLQMHSHKGSKVPAAFVLSSRVVTKKLLFLFLQWNKLQQLPMTELYICSLPCASCNRRTMESHLHFQKQIISMFAEIKTNYSLLICTPMYILHSCIFLQVRKGRYILVYRLCQRILFGLSEYL